MNGCVVALCFAALAFPGCYKHQYEDATSRAAASEQRLADTQQQLALMNTHVAELEQRIAAVHDAAFAQVKSLDDELAKTGDAIAALALLNRREVDKRYPLQEVAEAIRARRTALSIRAEKEKKEPCVTIGIVVEIAAKLGPTEYEAYSVNPWGGGQRAGPFVLRTDTQNRFQGNERGWITICKNKSRHEKYELNGFERLVQVAYEAPAKLSSKMSCGPNDFDCMAKKSQGR